MADTRQCVLWSLERACSLRTGDGWQYPIPTQQSLYTLQQCSVELTKSEPQIVDGIWVTGKYWGRDSNEKTVYIPSSGIKIDDIGQQHGGMFEFDEFYGLRLICEPIFDDGAY